MATKYLTLAAGGKFYPIALNPVVPNTPPVITSTAATTASSGAPYSYTVVAEDPGDTITYSMPVHPDGMTIDAYTGVISWTPDDGDIGSNAVTVRATDSEAAYDEQSFSVEVDAFSGTNIDAQWLIDNGPAPYMLDTASEVYRLTVDVTVDGTAFLIGEANVTLDLNGHTITYGNTSPLTVANGGFETGAGSTVPNWDLTNAPSATLVANTIYAWGDKVLAFQDITAAEYIVSDTISPLTPGREYAATASFKCLGTSNWLANGMLEVIDSVSGDVLGSTTLIADRGYSVVVMFTPGASNTSVKLRLTATPGAGLTQTIYLDCVTLNTSRDFAIGATGTWLNQWPSQLASSANITACRKAADTVVRNGTITQGQARSHQGHAIWARDTKRTFTVSNCTISVNGNDARAIWLGSWDGLFGHTIEDNTITADIVKITNRMGFGEMILVENTTGSSIARNAISDHPQGGITITSHSGHDVSYNTVNANATSTNCYGILIGGMSNSAVHHNTIVTTRSGRGIYVGGGYGAGSVSNIDIYSNYVDIIERPNLEYGITGIQGTALRVRSDESFVVQNLYIHDNTFIARTDASHNSAALGGRLTFTNNSNVADWGIVINNNTFRAIVDTTNTAFLARAFSLEGLQDLVNPLLSNNIFESNDISFGFGGADGANAQDAVLVSNTFTKSATGAARTYYALLCGSSGVLTGIDLINNLYSGGASEDLTANGTYGTKSFDIGWLLNVNVTNEAASPIAGATVTVEDSEASEIYSGVTDANGVVQDVHVVVRTLAGTTTLSTTNHYPHTLSVTASGYHPYSDVFSLTESTTVNVELTAI